MDAPLEKIVVVDEVRPNSFHGDNIPVTNEELDFFQENIPFSLTHEYSASLNEKINLLHLLFHRAIKLENSYVSRNDNDKDSFLNYEVEKITPLVAPLGLKVKKLDNQLTTLFALKYVLSEAIEEVSKDFNFGLRHRSPDYSFSKHEIKKPKLINAALSVLDKSPHAFNPLFLFGSVTNIKHNALKYSFSDIDVHLIAPFDSFREYKEIVSFVAKQARRRVPLSVNIIPENHTQSYFVANPNNLYSPENSILKNTEILYPVIPDSILIQQWKSSLAQNLLRTKKALVESKNRRWDTHFSAFNARGKNANLVLAYMNELSESFSSDYLPFFSRNPLPPFKTAKTILTNQSVEISRVFKEYLSQNFIN